VIGELDLLDVRLRLHAEGFELDDDRLRPTLEMLDRQFASHMAAEDEVLYPALLEAMPGSRATVGPLRDEHAELRRLLAEALEVMKSPPSGARDEKLAVQLRDLVDLLRIHIRKEEALVFGIGERLLRPEEMERLAARMAVPRRTPPPDHNSRVKSKGEPS
jgi:hemerythrin-like domain-containing protein